MKKVLKSLAYAFAVASAMPHFLFYRLAVVFLDRKEAFYGASQWVALYPGLLGSYIRWGFYRLTLKRLGADVRFGFMATLSHPDICIGKGAYIGPFCNLGLCSIGDHVLLGTGCHVLSGFKQHRYDSLDLPIRDQGGENLEVHIGEDCWIGNQAVIGNHVGAHSVIGAASLVVAAIPEYSVAVGQPARVLRDRRDSATKPDNEKN